MDYWGGVVVYVNANGSPIVPGTPAANLDAYIEEEQADAFEKEGSFTERLYRIRRERRKQAWDLKTK